MTGEIGAVVISGEHAYAMVHRLPIQSALTLTQWGATSGT